MTLHETPHFGNTRSSYSPFNLRNLAARVGNANPKAGYADLCRLLEEAAHEEMNDLVVQALVSYWAGNAARSYLHLGATSPTSALSAQNIKAQVAENIKSQMKLLGMIAPNGKAWGQCTKEEMIAFGGWCTKLAAGMKKGQTVAQRYTEEQIRAAQTWK